MEIRARWTNHGFENVSQKHVGYSVGKATFGSELVTVEMLSCFLVIKIKQRTSEGEREIQGVLSSVLDSACGHIYNIIFLYYQVCRFGQEHLMRIDLNRRLGSVWVSTNEDRVV